MARRDYTISVSGKLDRAKTQANLLKEKPLMVDVILNPTDAKKQMTKMRSVVGKMPAVKMDATLNPTNIEKDIAQIRSSIKKGPPVTMGVKFDADKINQELNKTTKIFKGNSSEISRQITEMQTGLHEVTTETQELNEKTGKLELSTRKVSADHKASRQELEKSAVAFEKMKQKATDFSKIQSTKIQGHMNQYDYADLKGITSIKKELDSGEVFQNLDTEQINRKIVDYRQRLASALVETRKSHRQNLDSITTEIKLEKEKSAEVKKRQLSETKIKDDFNKRNINGFDYDIKKKELESQQFSKSLKSQMEQNLVVEKEVTAEKMKQTAEMKKQSTALGKQQLSEVKKNIALKKQLGDPTSFAVKEGYNTTDVRQAIKNNTHVTGSTIASAGSFVGSDGEKYDRFVQSIKKGSGEWQNYTYNVKNADGAIGKIDTGITNTNKALALQGDTLGKVTTKFLKWVMLGEMIYMPIRLITQAFTEMKAVDTELSEIGKATDTPIAKLGELRDKAFEVGSAFGVVASKYLEAVTAMSRAGYKDSSDALGQLSVKAQVAGDMDAQLANDWILADDAAFKLGGDVNKLSEHLDKANRLTNRNAVEMKDLASGYKVAGAQAAQMGLRFEETNAMIGTMTAVTRQGGNVSGRASKGILMNLQQVKGTVDEETGEMVDQESISKASKALDDVNIKTMELRDGILELRNPMKVLDEIALKWESLSSMDQAKLTDALGGKYRGNQFVGLMENWDMYNKMMEDQVNATGSAQAEVDIYLKSWEGRVNQLANTWTEFVAKTIDAEWIKTLISAVIEFVNLIDTGVGRTVLAIAALAVGITLLQKGIMVLATTMKGTWLGTFASSVKAAAKESLVAAANAKAQAAGIGAVEIVSGRAAFANLGFAASLKAVTVAFMASPFAIATAIIGGIWAIGAATDYLTTTFEEQSKIVDDLSEKINSLESERDNLLNTTGRTDKQERRLKLLEQEIAIQNTLNAIEVKKKYEMEWAPKKRHVGRLTSIESGKNSEAEKSITAYEKLQETKSTSLEQDDEMIEEEAKLQEELVASAKSLQEYTDAGVELSKSDEKILADLLGIIDTFEVMPESVADATKEVGIFTESINNIDPKEVNTLVGKIEELGKISKESMKEGFISSENLLNLQNSIGLTEEQLALLYDTETQMYKIDEANLGNLVDSLVSAKLEAGDLSLATLTLLDAELKASGVTGTLETGLYQAMLAMIMTGVATYDATTGMYVLAEGATKEQEEMWKAATATDAGKEAIANLQGQVAAGLDPSAIVEGLAEISGVADGVANSAATAIGMLEKLTGIKNSKANERYYGSKVFDELGISNSKSVLDKDGPRIGKFTGLPYNTTGIKTDTGKFTSKSYENKNGGKNSEKDDPLKSFKESKRIADHRIGLSEKMVEQFQAETESYKSEVAKQADLMNKMMKLSSNEANKLRKAGYSETSEEIQELQNAWWEYKNQLTSLYEAMYEDRRGLSNKWIEDRKLYDDWGADNEIKALKRIKTYTEEYYKTGLIGKKKYAEEMAELDKKIHEAQKELLSEFKNSGDKILNEEKDKNDKLNKSYDTQISKLSAIISLKNQHYDLVKSISSEQRDIDSQLKIAKESYQYLNEETRKMLFNEEDYNKLSSKLKGLGREANSLYSDYQKEISSLTEDNIYLSEEITAEFERQYALKMKEYEIAKAELGLAKAQSELQNVQNERNTMMLIDGQFQWVADPEAVKTALESLADAENNYADTVKDLEHQRSINELEASKSVIETQKKKLDAEYQAMEENWKKVQASIEEPVRGIEDILKDIAENATPELKNQILAVADALSQLSGMSVSKTKQMVGGGGNSGSSGKGYDVKVQSNGKAPSGLSVGTTVGTAGGTFKITGVNKDGSYKSEKINSNKAYDKGGIARGIGKLFKATTKDEMVLPPDTTSELLNPIKSENFLKVNEGIKDIISNSKAYAEELERAKKIGMYSAGEVCHSAKSMSDYAEKPNTQTINNTSNDTFVNGVKVEGTKGENLSSALRAILPINSNPM